MNYCDYGSTRLGGVCLTLDLAMGCFVELKYIRGMETVFRAFVPAAIANIGGYNRSNDA